MLESPARVGRSGERPCLPQASRSQGRDQATRTRQNGATGGLRHEIGQRMRLSYFCAHFVGRVCWDSRGLTCWELFVTPARFIRWFTTIGAPAAEIPGTARRSRGTAGLRPGTHRRLEWPQRPATLHLGRDRKSVGPGADLVRPHWIDGPRSIDEKRWLEIIGDEPTLILLDELPPYLLNADTRAVGKGTLADLATYTISNLLTAAIKLPRCCVVIANLSGSYEAQTKDLARIMSNLQQESRRQAQMITPVQLAGNEIYEILKKRLFTELPGESLIDSVAEAFAVEVKAAEDGGYMTARAMEQVAEEVRET